MDKEETLKSIGRKIALFRKLKGLNQFDLASESGKMINTISNIERGIADPRLSTLLAIMNVLGISWADLTEDGEYDIALNSRLIHIIDRLRSCDEKTLSLIARQIDIALDLKNSNGQKSSL